MSKWQSQFMQLPFCGSRLPNLQAVHQARIVLLLLVLCSVFPFLFASECADNEIPGPESGVVDPRYRPEDKVVALTSEWKFDPDKTKYDIGDFVRISYCIKVDTNSRGYESNRSYSIVSPYKPGYEIKAGKRIYWKVINSDLDTLVIIGDNQSISGVIMLELVPHKSNLKTTTGKDQYFMYTPSKDSLSNITGKYGRAPVISLDMYRISLTGNNKNAHQHTSGKFSFDQHTVIHMVGDGNDWFNKKLNQAKEPSIKQRIDIPCPDFEEMASAGLPSTAIKVLRNSTLVWRIYNDVAMSIVTVSLVGDAHGCTVAVNPNDLGEYILTTSNTSNCQAIVRIVYYSEGTYHTHDNLHYIIESYNIYGNVWYNSRELAIDSHIAPFIGKIVLWGSSSSTTVFERIETIDLKNSTDGFFMFSSVEYPIVQIGFYVEYDNIPILQLDIEAEENEDVYKHYTNGIRFHHPESSPLCNNQLNFWASYRIMLVDGISPDNVEYNNQEPGVIRFKDTMSCGALNIASQIRRVEDFLNTQSVGQTNLCQLDFTVFLDRDRVSTGNGYYPESCINVLSSSCITYRGVYGANEPA